MIVTKEGVQVYCTRMRPMFVAFDVVYEMPGHTFIKVSLIFIYNSRVKLQIKNKGRVFNVPHNTVIDPREPSHQVQQEAVVTTPTQEPMATMAPAPLAQAPAQQQTEHATNTELEEELTKFYESIRAATTGIPEPK